MNQLVYSADYENNMAYTYDYDADGNITAEYIYTDGATGPSSSTTTNVYTYGDSNWKDKLTAYKGQTITYDQIGTPLTYRDGITMTWQNGRQLATLQQGNNSISYKYDSNSIRTSKTVNGVEYTYAYLNGKLMYETRGETTVWEAFYDISHNLDSEWELRDITIAIASGLDWNDEIVKLGVTSAGNRVYMSTRIDVSPKYDSYWVYDYRNSKDDTGVTVIDSYKATVKVIQLEIIDMLLEYEKIDNTAWERTK